MWGSRHSLCFCTYFCDCDAHLYDRSKITHISNGITRTVKPPSKLVHFEVLAICRLRPKITLNLWKSMKVAWPNFRFSLGRILICVYGVHIRHFDMSDRIVAHSYPDDLGLHSCQWHTLKKIHEKPISPRLFPLQPLYGAQSYSLERSSYRLYGINDLGLRKKVKTLWPTFRFSGSSTPKTWARTFIFGRMADVRPWPTFATVIHILTHILIIYRGRIRHTAVVRLRTTDDYSVSIVVIIKF